MSNYNKEINFTNIKSFIDYIITFNNIDDILDTYKSQSEKGFIFERLWDIIIKFGFCDIFKNSEYKHLIGNSNNGKLKKLENLNQYLEENVRSGNSGGCVDIALQNIITNEYIFISSKYHKSIDDKQKSVDYYDIQNIIGIATQNKHIYESYKIYLVVPNKIKLLDKVKAANKSSSYITEHMTEDNILDKNDLNKYFLTFKKDIIKNKNEDWQTIYLNSKENLILRFHQELITQKTSNLITEGNKSFLWGCKCRSGKTYMIGGIIIKQFNIKKKLNVLIITPAPTETAPQFTNDLFNKFKDFDKFKIHHIEGSKIINSIETSENNIFIMSKQLLQKYINNDTISTIKNLKLDIIGFDENHFSGTTDLSKDILQSYSTKNTIKIYLTATYAKPLKEWNILSECQMFWDIEDEQICKSILIDNNNLSILKEKHGDEYITKTIKYYTNLGLKIDDIFKSYERMPDLHLITNLFDQQRYEIIKEKLNKENKMGFCFDTLFGLNKVKTKFSFENEVKTILRYISGSHKEEDGEKTIFPRINNICSEKETRLPFTQIWFLPSDNINEISECLKKIMLEDLILKKYDVLCINRSNKKDKKDKLPKDIKDEINKKEIEAKARGKLGLILLAGNMLTLGITLNLCDLVILMNNTLSSDKVLQQMYRCMTEGDNKKIGFVVDLNISRVLNTCINYTVYKNEKSIDDKMKYLIYNHLINIDIDMMLNKKINSDMIVKKLMDIWKEDPINSFRTLLRKLDNDYEEFDNSTQKLINKTFTKNLKDNKIGLDVILKDEDDEIQKLPTGKEKVKNDSDTEDSKRSDNDENSEEEQIETQISFTKDVLPYVIPLTCILTIKNSNMDFVKMLNDIKETPELLDTFNDQCLIWWNKKDLIELIKDIVNKYFDKNSNTYNISVQIKMSLQSLIDNPKELLEFITHSLKPKDVEKKQFGEVFTPINLVYEMLDKLPIEVWKNKNLKWLDPASGMGNFPIAVYLRLMEGLKDEIKDIQERKKHILENMLYMCELNKKNVLICNQIFNINNEYQLNLYQGDSLKIDTNKEWGIKYFDIIIGNPPYQQVDEKGHSKGGGNNLYSKFIYKGYELLKKDGYLVFINPPTYFGVGRSNNKDDMNIRKDIFNNCNILYINLEECNKYFPNIGSLFIYYVIQKNERINKKLEIICRYDNKNYTSIINQKLLNDMIYIPYLLTNMSINICKKIKDTENKLKIFHSPDNRGDKKHVKKLKNEEFKYPIQATGVQVLYSSKPCKNQYDKKVLMSRSGYLKPFYDNGVIGVGGDCFCCLVNNKEDGDYIIKLLESKLYTFYININKWSGFHHLSVLQDIPYIKIDDINDEYIYKYFKLDEEEIKFVESVITKNTKNDKKEELKINYNIIKYKRKNYYLIENKVYIINKNKSKGDLIGDYINEKVIEIKNDEKEDNNDNDIVLKKKSIKKPSKEDTDIFEVKKKKSIVKKL
jgi:hypothetical protein